MQQLFESATISKKYSFYGIQEVGTYFLSLLYDQMISFKVYDLIKVDYCCGLDSKVTVHFHRYQPVLWKKEKWNGKSNWKHILYIKSWFSTINR